MPVGSSHVDVWGESGDGSRRRVSRRRPTLKPRPALASTILSV